MKRTLFAAAFSLATITAGIGTFTPHAVAQQPPVAQPATLTPDVAAKITQAWATAISSGRLDDWMNLHAIDVEFANHSWFKGKRRDEMRRWGQAVIDAGGVYRITEHRIENGNLIWMIDYKDRSFAIREMGTVTVVNGEIKKLILGNIR